MPDCKLSIAVALAVLCAGCGQQAAVTTAPTLATAATAVPGSAAAVDPDAQCKSWGIQPGSPGYKQCVDGLKEAANAGASNSGTPDDAQIQMAKMRADMAQQRDDMRTQMTNEMKAAGSNPKCVTVTNGTNTSVSCPQ